MSADEPERPSPEALLEATRNATRGRLRIFLGAAPGVGKTCAMLKAAQRKRSEGIDVVVGIAETHGRRDTQALLDGLEQQPRRDVPYRGRLLPEMDLDGLLRRRPQLALVDELAHTNAEGSRHPKRYQDVAELLDAGIDVWSTLNVQHIESLNDVVTRITRVRVRETVPDQVFDTADEVEVVDLTPQELIERLNDGKVYAEAQAQAALKNWFKPGNLTALRELALRRTAERVDDQMRAYMRSHAIRGPWAAGERLLVCINEAPAAAEVVRRTKRLADRLNAPWFALHVETARTRALGAKAQTRIVDSLRLAESLGAETLTLPGTRRIADDLLGWARNNNITQIVVGKTARPWWFAWRHGSVVTELLQGAGGIDLHILAEETAAASVGEDAEDKRAGRPRRSASREISAYVATALMVAAATLLGRALLALVSVPNISLIYLAAVLWSATRYGLGASIFASIASTLAYNFFFTEPQYTFNVGDPSQVLALIFFCLAAVLTSTLTARERVHAEAAHEQALTTAELLAFSRKLAGIRKLDTLMAVTAAQIANMLEVDAMLLLPDAGGRLVTMASAPAETVLVEADLAAASWCWDKNQPTGRGTDTLPGGRCLFLPLRTGQGSRGVVGISRAQPDFRLTPEERRLLDALIDLAAIATERIRLAKDVDQARLLAETEKLRASLLTSVSHDLRTPLASIIGTLASLRSFGMRYDEATRDELLGSAQDEAERLNRYVANLLDMTRIDAGALQARREPCDLADLIAAAVRRCQPALASHRLKLSIPKGLPLLLLDEALMDQVLVNLLDNAAKYTPAGSTIEIGVARHRFSIVISVRDDGPGLPPADLDRIFDKFYRVREDADRTRAGTGLGLAICRGFVLAMGGRIHARNRSDDSGSGSEQSVHGAEFLIEFSPELIAETPALPATGVGAGP